MTQTYVFGGSPVQPSQVSYAALSLTANTELAWPWVDQDTDSAVPLYLYVTPTGAYSITMPDATGAGNGQATIIFNVGPSTITILDNTGGAIATITTGIAKYIILQSNATVAGTWQAITFGAGTNAADAAALAGYGLSALSGAALNTNNPVVAVTGSGNATASYRAQVFEVTAATGAGTLTFDGAAALGNGWWMGLSNLGTGAWTLDPNGAETIDGQSTIILNPTETCLIFSSGTALYTIGRGRSVDFAYTALNKSVAGSANVTLTTTEASNLLIKLTGILTGSISLIVPAVVNEYMVRNATTGAYTVTIKTASGVGVVATQGEQAFIKCDGTDCFNVVTNVPTTGTYQMPNGTSSLPGLSFQNDATTGFYRPSAGVLGFAVLANAIFTATATGVLLAVTGTAQDNVPSLRQVQAGAFEIGTVGGTADVITLTVTPAIAAYAAGQEFQFTATGTNTTNVTVNVSAVGAKALQANSAALVAGDVVSGRTYTIRYDGTQFQMYSSRAAVDHTADIADSAVTTVKINNNAVTFAKMQAITDGVLLGASGGTAVEQITVGNGLALASNTLTALAGGGGNLLINGGMQVNQRVVTTGAADDTYINDRFYILTQTSTITISQLSLPANGVQSAVRLTQAQASAQRMGVAQIVEAVNCQNVRGQAVASNWWVTSSTSQTIRYAILEWTGTADSVTSDVVLDWTSSTYTAGNFFLAANLTVTATGSLAVTAATPAVLPAITGTCGSSTNNLIVFVWTSATCAQNVTLDLSMAQCALGASLGSFVWPQQPAVLAQCQRYYQKSFAQATKPAQNSGTFDGAVRGPQTVGASTVNNGGFNVIFPVVMRVFPPTRTLYNPAAANAQARNSTVAADCTSTSIGTVQDDSIGIVFTSPGASAAGDAIFVHYTMEAEL